MKLILTFLFINLSLMQELQVEGDLIVTGNISSAIIDSLQNEINNLQDQLNEYSGVVKTRIIDVEVSLDFDENNDVSMFVPLNELVGASNNWYKIIPLSYGFGESSCGAGISIITEYPYGGFLNNDISYGNYNYNFESGLHISTVLPIIIYDESPTIFIYGDLNASNCSGTITLLVTSEN